MAEIDQISADKLPQHVALIMDGNRRWAVKHKVSKIQGHEAGLENMANLARHLNELKVKYATVYAFSTENWSRPQEEVAGLLKLLDDRIEEVAEKFHQYNIRLRHLGSLDRLSGHTRNAISRSIELTKNNTGLILSFCFNYGGRSEIVHAVKRLIQENVPVDKIDEKFFSRYLYTDDMPDVDLLIRTGGELRISNFLIWQSAYSEYYFSDALWPDFSNEELDKAITVYSHRQRRFGRL